jgi:predicted anti-sigma-YlaC factor YlaD
MTAGRIERGMSVLRHPMVATCEETESRLSAYVDGDLRSMSRRRIERHLSRCRGCQEVLDALTRALGGLRTLGGRGETPATSSLAETVVDRIRRDDP